MHTKLHLHLNYTKGRSNNKFDLIQHNICQWWIYFYQTLLISYLMITGNWSWVHHGPSNPFLPRLGVLIESLSLASICVYLGPLNSAANLNRVQCPLVLGLLDCQATNISRFTTLWRLAWIGLSGYKHIKVYYPLVLGLDWVVRLQTFLPWQHYCTILFTIVNLHWFTL